MKKVSTKLSKKERKFLKKYAKLHSLSLSKALRTILIEKIEDDLDLKMIEEYEADQKKDNFKYLDLEEVWKKIEEVN